MAFTSVTVTSGPGSPPAGWTQEDGTPAAGTVTFRLTAPMSNDGNTVVPVPVTVTLNASGSFSVALDANDDSGTTPEGVQYTVLEEIGGASSREYNITVPSGLGATVELSSLMPGQPGFD